MPLLYIWYVSCLNRGFLKFNGNPVPEEGALAGFTLNTDLATTLLDDDFANGES